MTIRLEKITAANWQEAIRIDVAPEQRSFVASNLYSLAESRFHPTYEPLGIYDQAGTMVGFLMYGINHGEYWILRLMVDQRYQGRGYGRAAMQEALRRLAAKPECRDVFTSYEPENHVAAKLYASLGFQDTGLVEDGELVVRLPVAKGHKERT